MKAWTKGLLFKSITAFFFIAFSSFYLSYLYTNYSQEVAIENELRNIKNQGTEAFNIILKDRVEQLTLFAEEMSFIGKSQNEYITSPFSHLTYIWPKIKFNRSLNSLYIESKEILQLGKPLPAFLMPQAINAKKNLTPYHRIYCSSDCEIAISIPIFLYDETASLTLISGLIPAVIYANKSLHIDIGLINQSGDFNNDIIEDYPFEILTNIQENENILEQLTLQKEALSSLIKGHFHYDKVSNKTHYIWGTTIGDDGSEATFIFFKDITLTMEKYTAQKRGLLIYSSSISFSISIIIALLVFYPLKKLRLLTNAMENIGAKNYKKAKKILEDPSYSNSKDELSTLKHVMYTALNRIEDYEIKIHSNQQALKYQATVDNLTKLLNRNAFTEKISNIQEQTPNKEVCLALIDLDGFKPVNDNLGHEAGDEVLRQVGYRLSTITSKTVTPYRLGGDEFVVCITESGNDELLYHQLVSLFKDDFEIANLQLKITASIGIASGVINNDSRSVLLRQADIAMYEAKKLGKNRFCVFELSMMEHSNLRFTITNDFLTALSNQDIYLNFQPIVNTQTLEIVKVEALSRWKHPQVGFIRPDIFISVIEETPYIQDLSNWLIQQCISQLLILRSHGFKKLIISINISAVQISDTSSLAFIKNECDQHNIPYYLIELEITETSLISNFKAAKQWIHDAHKIGFKVSIDDFGTGYSSLSYLTQFPFDTVKIDRSLIKDIPGDLNQQKLSKSIIRMLQDLDVNVIVEGIEHEEQFNVMKEYGADMIQGFYFFRPLDKVTLIEALHQSCESVPKKEKTS